MRERAVRESELVRERAVRERVSERVCERVCERVSWWERGL